MVQAFGKQMTLRLKIKMELLVVAMCADFISLCCLAKHSPPSAATDVVLATVELEVHGLHKFCRILVSIIPIEPQYLHPIIPI